MAAGKVDYLADFDPRQVCQVVYDHDMAAERKLRGRIDTLETVLQAAARNFTIRPVEALAKYLCSLMRRAERLATLKTFCLLHATYWFRPSVCSQVNTRIIFHCSVTTSAFGHALSVCAAVWSVYMHAHIL